MNKKIQSLLINWLIETYGFTTVFSRTEIEDSLITKVEGEADVYIIRYRTGAEQKVKVKNNKVEPW